MKTTDAETLLAALAAAWPFPKQPVATLRLYREKLITDVHDVEAARQAVEGLIATELRFPPLALVLRDYAARKRRLLEERAERVGIPEPLPDPGNAAKAREILRRLESSIAERAKT